MKTPFLQLHGNLRGLEGAARSPLFEGRFGRMFRALPPAPFAEEDLKELATQMVAEHEDNPTPETEQDDEENVGSDSTSPTISAGYTYLGQFIDHDLTLDPASSLQKQNDPNALVDFRTPRFDLDCLYGRGPDDQPYLYQEDGVRMLLGRPLTGNPGDPKTRDVPRNSPGSGPRRALIGDPRNDENVIVSQIQSTMLRFHNRVADVLQGSGAVDFTTVQQQVRWHYQWVVLNDFLPTIIGKETLHAILPNLASGKTVLEDRPQLRFYTPHNESFMPVEFSVAAYRFGHSMIRPIYRLNGQIPRFAIFSSDPNTSLVGFREFPSNWAIDWRLFFKMGTAPALGPERIQPAYKIDSSLVNPLGSLPESVATQVSSLAERNLLRGLRMGLPSGQAVARVLGIPAVPDDKLRVGKANEDDRDKNTRLVDISPAFKNNAPLWYYVLAESQQVFKDNKTPIRLGPVGGRIVGEVFAGLMLRDQHSFLSQEPNWKPLAQFTKKGTFGMAQLIAQAMQA